jgi:predicted nucleic acid-binding protein
MPGKAFFDTNVLIYAFSVGDHRRNTALELLMTGGTVGIQSLNEFANIATRKMKAPWPETLLWLERIRKLCDPPVPLTLEVHYRGLQIAQALGYRLYDSLLLAAALESSCTVFYSENMQNGHQIADLTIRNPFTRRR